MICAASLVAFMLAQPLAGALSDRIGRKPLLYWYGIGGVLLTVPLLTAIGATHTAGRAWLLATAALMILVGTTSISSTMKAELFPVGIRALGVGLPYAVSTSIFSGSAEYVALWFKSTGRESGFFWYVSACIAISLVAICFAPETRWQSCMDAGPAEADGPRATTGRRV